MSNNCFQCSKRSHFGEIVSFSIINKDLSILHWNSLESSFAKWKPMQCTWDKLERVLGPQILLMHSDVILLMVHTWLMHSCCECYSADFTLFCVSMFQLSGVLCWHFSQNINRVLSCLNHQIRPDPPPSSIDPWQFVSFLPAQAHLLHLKPNT